MTVRVELVSGRGTDFDPAPGSVFVVVPNNSFGDLADAIDLHFSRWDLGHLHVLRLHDGRRIGYPDPEFPDWLDHERITVTSALSKGEEFEYVFDLGDDWTHECTKRLALTPWRLSEPNRSYRSQSGAGDLSPISTGVELRTTRAMTFRGL